MSKFIKILAASIGGGIVLGAGIRLGEAIAAQNPPSSPDAGRGTAEKLEEKFERKFNKKIEALEAASVGSGIGLQVPLYGKSDQAGDTFDLEFAHDISAISVDRLRAYF